MIKRYAALWTAFFLLMSSACAENWSGSVISTVEAPILASASGILEELNLLMGEKVSSGDIVGHTSITPVFAEESGTVSLVTAHVGDIVSDTFITIAPVCKYRIISSTSDAYSSPETTMIHGGEIVYIRCMADRSHLAIGFTANISGSTFDVFTTAGELYIGESVNLYRKADYSYESKVGIGTVVENDLKSYSADGHILSIRVKEGDYVERGQLLFTYASSATTDIIVSEDGIITSITGVQGQNVKQDQVLATIALQDSIRIQFPVPETQIYLVHIGDEMYYLRADDPYEIPRKAIVSGISHMSDGDTYAVYLIPEDTDLPIGLTITVVDKTIL
ncbi:MAG: HlyD family efflux transporter periplasmic adaptor subunit [Clostridiales bacterium]|nr:HlyD family efflux transporter periplasmic adaptor subunit [Clostridiales bacterium]